MCAAAGSQDGCSYDGSVRNPSPPFRGERKGPTPPAWEGEVGRRRPEIPHLTPTLSAPKGGEGERPLPPPLQIATIRACPWRFRGGDETLLITLASFRSD